MSNLTLALLSLPLLFTMVIVALLIKIRREYRYHQQKKTTSEGLGTETISIGFFHPYANGGGGGERVLYGAMLALVQQLIRSRKKSANQAFALELILYTGDDGLTAKQLIANAARHFNLPQLVDLHVDTYITLVLLRKRDLLNPSRYPRFTLLWQGVAQFRLALDAFESSRQRDLYPQIWLDTLGCPFSYLVASIGFGCTVMAYTHYPMISTDMIERVTMRESGVCNEIAITDSSWRSSAKYVYYRLFAAMYGMVGRYCTDVAMANSTWTHNHIRKLWGKAPFIMYPGCGSIQEYMEFDLENREPIAVSLSQFRPEKNHSLQLESLKVLFTEHGQELATKFPDFKLYIIGSCPTEESKILVETLTAKAKQMGVCDRVEFVINASFADLKPYLKRSSIGIHTMPNEHFGISNVEIMAAGIIHIAHDSAGPQFDIVKPGTGYLATTAADYADKIWQVLNEEHVQLVKMRHAARESTRRFSDDEFNGNFLAAMKTGFPRAFRELLT